MKAEQRAGVIARGMFLARALLRRFASDCDGNVFVIFGLSATVMVLAVGAGVDLANAYVVRQKLSNAATLTCQYANRPTNLAMIDNGASGFSNYQTAVNNFRNTSLTQQAFQALMTGANTPTAPVQFGASGATQVNGSALVNTNFMKIIGVSTLPVSVVVNCGSPATAPPQQPNGTIISEGFENSPCTGTCYTFVQANGTQGAPATPSSSVPANTSYTGAGGTQFKILGYCLEIDSVGIIRGNVPEGTHSAELDCDNGSGSAGNSSISTLIPLKAGEYELRYNFASRILSSNYSPAYVCGSTASDVAWANESASPYGLFGARTNQINVYLDQNTASGLPLHTTIDGTQQLGGSNLIDVCVDSQNWIERSVRITIATAGNYWLSFAADGASDSFGGQLDNIRFCNNPCPGILQDNFPFTANQLLFEETFDSPTVSQQCGLGGCGNLTSNLNASYGNSPGWPYQQQRGWAAAPYNQVDYEFQIPLSPQGSQYIQVDGNTYGSQGSTNRTISRYFYLDPGYYQLSYYYTSDVGFFSPVPALAISCVSPPYTSASFTTYAQMTTASQSGVNRLSYGFGSWQPNTNELAIFMSNSQMASTAIGGGSVNSATTFTNTDGSITTAPAVPPDAVNLSSYNTSQVNPLLDFCAYSASWLPRLTYIKIVKPGQYWLNIASLGSGDGLGAAIDDVKLTALGSLYSSQSLAIRQAAVTIPTAGPVPYSSISYTGLSFVADPLTPPAP